MAKGRGAKEIEMEHMTDKMMEDPVSKGIENTNGDLNTNEQSGVMKAETEMQKGVEAVEQPEPPETKTEVEFALNKEHMEQFDKNGDGLLDASEITAEIKAAMEVMKVVNKKKSKLAEKKGLTDLIRALDTNKDGKIQIKELSGTNATNPSFGPPTKDKNSATATAG